MKSESYTITRQMFPPPRLGTVINFISFLRQILKHTTLVPNAYNANLLLSQAKTIQKRTILK